MCYCGVVVFGHGAIQQCNQSNLLFSSVVLTDKGKKRTATMHVMRKKVFLHLLLSDSLNNHALKIA